MKNHLQNFNGSTKCLICWAVIFPLKLLCVRLKQGAESFSGSGINCFTAKWIYKPDFSSKCASGSSSYWRLFVNTLKMALRFEIYYVWKMILPHYGLNFGISSVTCCCEWPALSFQKNVVKIILNSFWIFSLRFEWN